MTEENGHIAESTDGLVGDASPVDSTEPSFIEIALENTKAEADAEAKLMASLGYGDAPEETQPDVEESKPEEEEVSDETTEEETTSEETTDDDSVEDDDTEKDEDALSDDLEELTYDETKGYSFPVKIKGEVKMMTFDQMQQQIARAESGSELSREAKAQIEEVAARKEALDAREALIEKQHTLSEDDVKLAQFNAHIAALEEAKLTASTWEDDKRMSNDIKKFKDAARTLEDEITATRNTVRQNKLAEQQKILQEANFTVSPALQDFVTSQSFEADAFNTINESAKLLMLIEKARQWDDLQKKSKGKPVKKLGNKSLPKGSGKPPVSPKDAKAVEASKRMSQGIGSEADADAVLARYMSATS